MTARALAAAALAVALGVAACTARRTPPPPRAAAAPNAAAAAVPNTTPPRRDPFEGADLSPKPPVEPRSPDDQQRTFLLPPGYRIAPILAEPAIRQPAAIAFDGNGRMFVLELRTYMLDADARDQLAPTSRISRWEDRDGDGVYESHTVFVDSLVFPRFVTPLGDGAILTKESNTDEVWKYVDADGDGRADRRELFTASFGRSANVEHQEASLFWAMDNWLYSTVNAFRVRWTPGGVLREPTGFNGAQWGASQDDDGKVWFQGGASGVPSHFQFPIAYGNFKIDSQYAPGFDDIWGAPMGLADMQGGMGVVRMPEGSLAKATAGSGANVYRGGRLPADLLGDYFYGEVVGRVVRRVRPVTTEGITRIHNAHQAERAEFVRSLDPLFRPVDVKTAPDGSMYVVDMYHGVIQESQWTPQGSYLRAKIEQYALDRIVGLGRIWRLTHDATPRDTTRPRMLDESAAQLVRHLRHENGWWRDMAQQLLVLRQDRSVAPALRTMARGDGSLVARFHALWTLEGLGALDAPLARALMADASPRVRVQAIRASETLYKAGDRTLAADWRRLATDADATVAIQAMLTLDARHVPDAPAAIRAATAASRAAGVRVVGAQLLAPPPLAGRGPGNAGLSPTQIAAVRRGATAYAETCAACHGENGLGTPVSSGSADIVAPALAGSPRVGGHRDYVVRTLLHGLVGPIDGTAYAGQIMVSHGQHADDWIAAVASYLRTNLTNQASYVTPEQVARARAATASRTTPWTYPELAAAVPVRLPVLASWKATASHAAEHAHRALTTAAWSTLAPQAPGMWWQVELPEAVTLAELEFVSRQGRGEPNAPPPPAQYPRGYRVQLSLDGATWGEPVAEGASSGVSTTIPFAPTRARFVRVTQTARPDPAPPWSLQELRLYVIPTSDTRSLR